MPRARIFWLLWAILLQVPVGQAEEESAAIAAALKQRGAPEQAATCVACHQIDGNSTTLLWPKIAGQHFDYLYNQLQEFKKGEEGLRPHDVMYGMAVGLSDQDMLDLAEYYSQQTVKIGKVPAKYLPMGQKIYRGGILEKKVPACAACHMDNGGGNAPGKIPALRGQNADYVIEALKAYRSDARQTDPQGIMRAIAKRMTETEMEAVANYVMGLH